MAWEPCGPADSGERDGGGCAGTRAPPPFRSPPSLSSFTSKPACTSSTDGAGLLRSQPLPGRQARKARSSSRASAAAGSGGGGGGAGGGGGSRGTAVRRGCGLHNKLVMHYNLYCW